MKEPGAGNVYRPGRAGGMPGGNMWWGPTGQPSPNMDFPDQSGYPTKGRPYGRPPGAIGGFPPQQPPGAIGGFPPQHPTRPSDQPRGLPDVPGRPDIGAITNQLPAGLMDFLSQLGGFRDVAGQAFTQAQANQEPLIGRDPFEATGPSPKIRDPFKGGRKKKKKKKKLGKSRREKQLLQELYEINPWRDLPGGGRGEGGSPGAGGAAGGAGGAGGPGGR